MNRLRICVLGIVAGCLLAVLGLTGCAGQQVTARTTLPSLRELAADHPDDPDVQRALAHRELFGQGGDAGRAAAQLERALKLAPKDEGLLLASGVERALHGHFAQSVQRLLAALRAAADSQAPTASLVAEIAAASLRDLKEAAPNFAQQVEPVFEQLIDRPGRIGPAAQQALAELQIELALKRGDAAAARQTAGVVGCLTNWQVVGPFGPHALLGLDKEFAAERDNPLKDAYDLGANRGVQRTREHDSVACEVSLGNAALTDAGTVIARTTLEAPKAGLYGLRIESPHSLELSVDGGRVLLMDRRNKPLPSVIFANIQLDAGSHVVQAKIASRHPDPTLTVAVSAPSQRVNSRQGDPALALYLAAARAVHRGDPVGARELLRRVDVKEGSAMLLTLRAAVAFNDPLRPQDVRRDQARAFLKAAARRDPKAWFPVLQRARLAAAEGQALKAIQALEAAQKTWPEVVSIPIALTSQYLTRGWDARAQVAAQRARALAPGSCQPLQAELAVAQERRWPNAESRLIETFSECDRRSELLFDRLIATRSWDEAEKELERLQTLWPKQETTKPLMARWSILRGKGAKAEAAALLKTIEEALPRRAEAPLALSDLYYAEGKADAARGVFAAAFEREPASMATWWRTRRVVDGSYLLDRYRLDGSEIIRSFKASGRKYEAPQVMVLDYTVVRVFDDGSSLELTHNITRVQSQEAVDAQGEFNVPAGAELLTLRTIKEDGRRVEPDDIPAKQSISLSSLTIGDYVEVEYVRPRPARSAFEGGYIGDRFYFRSFEVPFDRTELTLILPAEMRPLIDTRGKAPKVEKQTADGLQVLRWAEKQSRPLEQEPLSVAFREYLPSVNTGSGATWERFVRGLRELLSDRDMEDPEWRRLALETVGETQGEERLKRLFAWVLENIEENGDAFGLAPAMMASRSGSRARVLAYLLEMLGVPAQLALARSASADATDSELAEPEVFRHLAVIAEVDGESHVMVPLRRGTPFGYLPPLLRGQTAILLEEGAPRITLPSAPEQDLRRVELDLELRADGSATGRVVESFVGAGAIQWRNDLEGIPATVLEARFEERYLGRLLAGARLAKLKVAGREDPESALRLEYTFELSSVGRKSGDSLVLPGLLPSHMVNSIAPTATRTTTELVAAPVELDVAIRIRPTTGLTLPTALPAVHLAEAGAKLDLVSEQRDGALVLERRLRVPVMRVVPQAYPALAAFARSVDQAEAREMAFPLR